METLKKKRDRMFEWEPDRLRGERSKRDKVVVARNVFDRAEFDADPAKILEYTGALREHCAKFGDVKKVILYDKHPEGVAQVRSANAFQPFT